MPLWEDTAVRPPRHLRRLAGALVVTGIAALPLLAVPTAAVAAPSATTCAIEQLKELPDWTMSIVTAGDPTGRYIAGRGYPKEPEADFHRFTTIWDNGAPTVIDIPGEDQVIDDVNASGDAVAISYREGELIPDAWTYRDGVVSPLPLPGEPWNLTLNDRGDIAGTFNKDGYDRPFVIRADGTGVPVSLPLPAGAESGSAQDIAADGTVVGSYTDAKGSHAYLWGPDGSGEELKAPEGAGISVRAVRGDWAAGTGATSDGAMVPVRWNLRTGEVAAYPQFAQINDVNTAGWLVGTNHQGKGLLVTDTGDVVLPSLVDHDDPFSEHAYTLSNDGRTIAGQALDATATLRAVAWRCT